MRWGERWSGFWGGPSSSALLAEGARDRLPRKIRAGANVRALAGIVGEALGDETAAILDVRHAIRNIDAAEGPILDLIGRVMQLPRNGDNDVRYRRALRTWALCRGSHATTEEILAIARTWLGAGPAIVFDPAYPMGFRLEISSMPIGDLSRLIRFIGAAKGAAYGAQIVITDDTTGLLVDTVAEDVLDAFTVDTVAEDVTDAGTVATIFDT